MQRLSFSNTSPWGKLGVFMLLIIISALIFSLLGVLAGYLFLGISPIQIATLLANPDTQAINYLKILQIFQSIGVFIIPPFIAMWLFRKEKENYLQLRFPSTYSSFFLVAILMIVAIPFINILAEINQSMILPDALSGFAHWMKQKELDAARLTELFLKADNLYTLSINVFVVGLLPAVGEELLFRGVIQKIIGQISKNMHWAIWITGFLFAAVHMQFYTFLPRFMMGVLFGYLFYWTASLWITILAHFINNAGAVIIHYLAQKSIIDSGVDNVGTSGHSLYWTVLSILFFTVIVYTIWKHHRFNQIV